MRTACKPPRQLQIAGSTVCLINLVQQRNSSHNCKLAPSLKTFRADSASVELLRRMLNSEVFFPVCEGPRHSAARLTTSLTKIV